MEDWAKQRMAELLAAAPVKRKKVGPSKQQRREVAYAQVGLKEAAAAFKLSRAPRAFVWVWLQYLAWKTKSLTFPLPNEELEQYGVRREQKRRALREYAKAGLITIEQQGNQSTIVTLRTVSACLAARLQVET